MSVRQIPPDRLVGLNDPLRGLDQAAVAARTERYGPNDIVIAPPSTWLDLARDTARDPMIWFLVGVSTLFALLGSYSEAAILVVAIVPLVGMDAYLHRRTQASTQGLASRLATRASAVRDGALSEIAARDVVPGDLLEVDSGAPVPADGLIVLGSELQFDESSLTGEAYPVRKQPLLPSPLIRSADTSHWAFAGTRLLTGRARIRIVETGGDTLYGQIVRSATAGSHARTPLQAAVGHLVAVLLVAALALCGLLAAVRLFQGHGIVDAFLSAVTLAVAALPEEFPVALTFFLGVGVYRLARRQALVRRAVAVENIGRVSCICSDKTGTLTEGRLVLAHRVPADDITPQRLAELAAIASRTESGDPIDTALIGDAPAAAPQRLASFPFTEDRRREIAITGLADGGRLAVVKGAPETVFAMCALAASSLATWRDRVVSYAGGGHKLIAVATRQLEPAERIDIEPHEGFVLCGILAFEDPVRDGVPAAVTACREAGIRVLMITGDHPATAEAIGREIGLGGGQPRVVLADSLEQDGTGSVVSRTPPMVDAVARATPSQKLQLVKALQAAGELVAVTGDGVNDVPALQTADVGIAMGERGTQSAREVAAIVLLDDNFATIVRAIAEGRQLFVNLQLAFAYLLMVHIPLVVSAALVPLASFPLLYLPIHIVWLELVIHPTTLLVFQELPTSDRLRRTDPRATRRFFSRTAWIAIVGSGLLVAAIISVGFGVALGENGSVEHARALSLGTLIGASAAVTAGLSWLATWTARMIIAIELTSVVLVVQVPMLADVVQLAPLHLSDWGLVAAASVAAGLFALAVRRIIRSPAPA